MTRLAVIFSLLLVTPAWAEKFVELDCFADGSIGFDVNEGYKPKPFSAWNFPLKVTEERIYDVPLTEFAYSTLDANCYWHGSELSCATSGYILALNFKTMVFHKAIVMTPADQGQRIEGIYVTHGKCEKR